MYCYDYPKKWKIGNRIYSPVSALFKIKQLNIKVAFIVLHGKFGEDGQIQILFETMRIPYTGSNPEASALAMNKAVSYLIFKNFNLTVPSFIHITNKKVNFKKISFPAVIKPNHGGSSIHVSFVNNINDALKASEKILKSQDTAIIQTLVKGREFTCGILEDSSGNPQPLPPTEIIPIKNIFFNYKAKYSVGGSREITPPNIPLALLKKIQKLALKAHTILGCSGMSRSDFIFDGKKLYILETNTIPGLTKTSLFPQEAQVAGISFSSMLDFMIQSALRKYNSPKHQ